MHGWRDHELLRRALEVFGLESLAEEPEVPAEIQKLAIAREDARARGDFAAADGLRDDIAAEGWEVRDEAGGYRLVRQQ